MHVPCTTEREKTEHVTFLDVHFLITFDLVAQMAKRENKLHITNAHYYDYVCTPVHGNG